jgi:hypothetical protein
VNADDDRIAVDELNRGEGHRFDDPAAAVRWLAADDDAGLSPRARRELDALAQVEGPRRAEAILTIHQRYRGGCLCGWAELGKSHPRHQVAMLREAGLLVADDFYEADEPLSEVLAAFVNGTDKGVTTRPQSPDFGAANAGVTNLKDASKETR